MLRIFIMLTIVIAFVTYVGMIVVKKYHQLKRNEEELEQETVITEEEPTKD